MRIGWNPQKSEKKILLNTHHRIIVVVYIPSEEGFYENSFEVFKTCLNSLISTINSDAAITVVNNGSYQKVSDYLNLYLKEKKIDTLISHNQNIGKIDALIGAARGAREKYLTLTDSDILFTTGWQEKTKEIFANFPNVGAVSPIPVRKGLYFGTSSVLKQILLRRIKFKRIAIPENFDAYNKYLSSINWDLEDRNDNKWNVVESNNCKANIGSGHQVLTIDRDILFKTVPTNPSLTLVGGSSENDYVDFPIDKAKKLRLSTYNNHAFHMGNKLETWMIDLQNENKRISANTKNHENTQSINLLNNWWYNKYFGFRKKIIKKSFNIFYN
ncbi:Glycosyl transferase family 2 [Flavobacterium resistens]|uniref:Glycosyl transferase family 2 n=1 Tax=Flavobacterium resistens TaxID=443612 RepID=A0A521EQV7_9FLAO|nr:glycosyltransferase family A protein [Flavobacterium resistens]MRX67896.1 glycosyltransferase [Flavobacterium resistens]SMO86319.1 Glycosyl transferase family 2 [Flavobacterium resistens]